MNFSKKGDVYDDLSQCRSRAENGVPSQTGRVDLHCAGDRPHCAGIGSGCHADRWFLALVGLAQCRKDDKGYRTAFNMVIAGLVTNLAASLVSAFAGTEGVAGICSNILSIATDVLSLASLYFVCITTNRLLKETAAAENLIDRGIVVWKLNVVCTVILLVCYLLRMIPGNIAVIIAGYLAIFAVIAQIIGSVLYILYLRNAYRALEAAVPPEEEVQQMM